jgi:hydrogenase nickel incorporation protein HypA/HybF
MHVYGIVAALIDRVAAVAGTAAGARVHRIHVAIGELAGVEAELLATAYQTFRAHSVCAEADLTVRRTPALWTCPRCGRDLAAGARLSCPDCAVPARLAAGDEIVLERIEMEVPDV